MHQPKHIYATGLVTGILCGLVSSLTVYNTMQYIASQNLEASNPVIVVTMFSIITGAIIGLMVSFAVHQLSKVKK